MTSSVGLWKRVELPYGQRRTKVVKSKDSRTSRKYSGTDYIIQCWRSPNGQEPFLMRDCRFKKNTGFVHINSVLVFLLSSQRKKSQRHTVLVGFQSPVVVVQLFYCASCAKQIRLVGAFLEHVL